MGVLSKLTPAKVSSKNSQHTDCALALGNFAVHLSSALDA